MNKYKHLFRIILILVLLIFLVLPLIIISLGLQPQPIIVTGKSLAFDDVQRIKTIVKQNDPRELKAGDVRKLTVTERDLNLFLTYALSQSPETNRLNAAIELKNGSADAQIAVLVPKNPFGNYCNITVTFVQTQGMVDVHKIKIGRIIIPHLLVNSAIRLGNYVLNNSADYRDVLNGIQSIEKVEINDEKFSMTYRWNPSAMERIQEQGRDILLPVPEQTSLLVYYNQIASLSRSFSRDNISLSLFLPPLFQLAQARSLTSHDPIAENRSLILALTVCATDHKITYFVSRKNRTPITMPRRLQLLLHGRNDLALHFLVSASISATSGSGLANLAGIFKEVDDSKGGSGFSFADLTADRTGVRFAEMATGSIQSAKRLQQRMSVELQEPYFMPRIDNLPEAIMEVEFKRTYKDLDSETYQQIDEEIARRVGECMLYQ
ncbi:hypothetical protein JW960_13655 [candidate division KSB1 bacterium]|nr:hypothetical protein [candidate division KSB1 bacterium]